MHIRNVTVENVKSFRGRHRFDLRPGVNFFVGDNNSGKSTVLEALLFLFEGPSASKWTPESFYCSDGVGPTRVVADIANGLNVLVQHEKFKLFKDYLFDEAGEQVLRLERSSEERPVDQNGKKRNLDVKAVGVWHPGRQQCENITGIDARVKALFDFEKVWADSQPGDHFDFANTKTLGKLLDSSFKRFTETTQWKSLAEAHERAFSLEEEDSFDAEARKLAAGIKELVDEPYGQADYRFDFAFPNAEVFLKQGRLHVDDGAGETPINSKGTGMQRAVALGIIQLYARLATPLEESNLTPLVLMLDEPETWLHPSAQLRLGEALSKIGEREQLFVITHSPYLIRKFNPTSHLLTVVKGQGAERRINPSTMFGLFGIGEPTWGEINFRAFGVSSNDFHNELYGRIQWHIEQSQAGEKTVATKDIDEFLHQFGLERCMIWRRALDTQYSTTLPTFVRNSIHHPENELNPAVNEDQLCDSIQCMVKIVESLASLSVSEHHRH